MEREGAGTSLHRLLGQAVMRSAHLQEESRVTVETTRVATDALTATVAEVRRCRARRAFGNRQSDAGETERPG